MKIKRIIKDGLPGDSLILSVNETRRIADLLEQNSNFEACVTSLRATYNIPKKGYDWDEYGAQVEYLFEYDEGALSSFFDICKLNTSHKLQLPGYMYGTIAYFVLFDVFITPERIPVETRIEKELFIKDELVTFMIIERISKTEFKEWVDFYWDKIFDQVNKLPLPAKHQMLRSELAKEIDEIRQNNNKLTYKQIADMLQEKYQDMDTDFHDALNEQNIKILHYRWLAKINKK